MENKDIFLGNLKNYMKENNISEVEFCYKVGIPQNSFNNWRDKQFNPDYLTIDKIARYIKFSIPMIFSTTPYEATKKYGISAEDYNFGNIKNYKDKIKKLENEATQYIQEIEKAEDETKKSENVAKNLSNEIITLKSEIKKLKAQKTNIKDLDIMLCKSRSDDSKIVYVDGEATDLICTEVDEKTGVISIQLNCDLIKFTDWINPCASTRVLLSELQWIL